MLNSLDNMTKLQEVKKVLKTGNRRTMTGFLQGDRNEYHKIDGKFYLVMCTDTAYIPDLSVNIFSVMRALTKGFNVTS